MPAWICSFDTEDVASEACCLVEELLDFSLFKDDDFAWFACFVLESFLFVSVALDKDLLLARFSDAVCALPDDLPLFEVALFLLEADCFSFTFAFVLCFTVPDRLDLD